MDWELRKEQCALREDVVLRDLDRCLGCLQIRIMIDRLFYELVEGWGFERRPPARRNLGACDKVLPGNARPTRSRVRRAQSSRHIAVDIRHSRRIEIRSDRAAGD